MWINRKGYLKPRVIFKILGGRPCGGVSVPGTLHLPSLTPWNGAWSYDSTSHGTLRYY